MGETARFVVGLSPRVLLQNQILTTSLRYKKIIFMPDALAVAKKVPEACAFALTSKSSCGCTSKRMSKPIPAIVFESVISVNFPAFPAVFLHIVPLIPTSKVGFCTLKSRLYPNEPSADISMSQKIPRDN